MVDTVLVMLKFGGILLAGVFGALGLLVKFRDEVSGKITRPGRIALILIVVSTLVSLLSAVFEQVRESTEVVTKAEAAEKAAKQTERTLFEISRLAQPITSIVNSYALTIPLSEPCIKTYADRIRREFPEVAQAIQAKREPPGHKGGMLDDDGKMLSVSFGPEFPLAPRGTDEATVESLVRMLQMRVMLYRKPIDLTATYNAKRPLPEPDLEWSTISMLGAASYLTYVAADQRLILATQELSVDEKSWGGTGALSSIPDLAGAQLVVQLQGAGGQDAEARGCFERVQAGMTLDGLTLNFGRGQVFRLRGKFGPATGNGPDRFFVYAFPSSVEALYKLR